jgi:hypothetical protein
LRRRYDANFARRSVWRSRWGHCAMRASRTTTSQTFTS